MQLEPEQEQQPVKKLSAWRAAQAVFWSFFGVRRGKDYAEDAAHLSWLQIVVGGIIGGILFVGTVLLLVNLVVP
jgi:hypothetical protein